MELHDVEEPPSRFGPIASPVDRFAHLSQGTRRWLESLSEDDITNIRALVRSYERASVIGWALKWIGFLTAGTFTATVTFGEGAKKIYSWFLGV